MLINYLNEILYEADLFKTTFVLLFRNKKQSSTYLGTFLSFALTAIILYLGISSNMVLKKNPNVIDQIITYDKSPLIELTPKNWQVAAGVSDSFGKGYYDPTIFKIQMVQVYIDFNATTNSKYISKLDYKTTHLCNESDFSDPNTFTNYGLNNFMCPDNGTFYLEGGFDEKQVKAVVILISYCNNKTDGVQCKTQDVINKYLLGKGLWYYYQDDIYDLSNYESPMTKNFKLQAIQVAAVPRIIDIYMKKLTFTNDDNFLFQIQNDMVGFMKDRTEGLSHYVMVESPLISFNFFSSKATQSARRQYQKFGDLLASIGGIINILMILGFILTNMQNKIIMQNHIMNNLYNYQLDKKKTPKGEDVTPKPKENFDWDSNLDELGVSYDGDKSALPVKRRHSEDSIGEIKPPLTPGGVEHDNYKRQYSKTNAGGNPSRFVKFGTSHKSGSIKEFKRSLTKFPSIRHKELKIKDQKDNESFVFNESFNEEKIKNPPAKHSNDNAALELTLNINNDRTFDSKRTADWREDHSRIEFNEKSILQKRMNRLNSPIYNESVDSATLRNLQDSTNRNLNVDHQKMSVSPKLPQKVKEKDDPDETKMKFHLFNEKNAIDMSLKNYFKMNLKVMLKKELTDKEKLFKISEKRFTKETDIVYILQKIQEFEKLKVILLNKEQLELFSLLSKPLIYLEDNRKIIRKSSSYRLAQSLRSDMDIETGRAHDEQRVKHLEDYYQKLAKQSKLSFIDRNILRIIQDQDFSEQEEPQQ